MLNSNNVFHVVSNSNSLLKTVRNTTAFNIKRMEAVYRVRRMSRRLTDKSLGELVEEFNARNIVFTVTSGRTGTDTLSKVCDLPKTTVAEHEPMPHYRYFLGLVQENPELAADIFCNLKVPAILNKKTVNYVETTHLFCKGFLEPCIAYGFRPSLIILKREPRKVAVSLLQKNAIPGRTGVGYRHLISPSNNSYLRLNSTIEYTDYELCYWYCLENELRQKLYTELAVQKGLSYFALETSELNNVSRCMEMFGSLDLASREEIIESLQPNWKASKHNQSTIKQPFDIDFGKSELKVRNSVTESMTVELLMDNIEKMHPNTRV